ncbi:dihydrolipoamide acetyltransferase family protein [Streptomyces longispororuber]|uniref:dihydrolipoamide acetyltransferase family protein n=1 Tax=Streptomyces longispororuber TaxID=68230 RepID=UPI00210984C7|nr:dihydrolipoamide acetyltransferase family protein [Streptomyces longispororuber]MCQ4205647.1 2-oxo acid dehydrogenase subunit E2 [Streptomyces longispororuber]
MAEFTMPSLGADMDEGVLQEWLVSPGVRVAKGDVVAVVETDKATIEVECFETGTVGVLLVEPGTRVPVGAPLAVIETADTRAPTEARREPAAKKPLVAVPVVVPATPTENLVPQLARPPARAPVAAGPPVTGPLVRHLAHDRNVDIARIRGTGRGGRVTRHDVDRASVAGIPRVRATPYARKVAEELNIDLTALQGTGEQGAVRAADVRAAGAATKGKGGRPAPVTRPPEQHGGGQSMRGTIAHLMARSKREIPHYYLSTTLDLATALAWLRAANRQRPVKERVLPAALLLKAAARAARAVPDLNGYWHDDHFEPGDGVHLGVAVSLRGGGLLTPVLRDADTLQLPALMAALKDLAGRARAGRLRASELTDATLTVTNLGDQGIETVLGVILPPQVAVVGFGAVTDRPCAVNGLLGVHPMVTATLSADHRASDGAVGARYLTTVDRLLQHPEEL